MVPGEMLSSAPLGTVKSSVIRMTPDQLCISSSKTPETSVKFGKSPKLVMFLFICCCPTLTFKLMLPGSVD